MDNSYRTINRVITYSDVINEVLEKHELRKENMGAVLSDILF